MTRRMVMVMPMMTTEQGQGTLLREAVISATEMMKKMADCQVVFSDITTILLPPSSPPGDL